MAVYHNTRMTYLIKSGEQYQGGHADNCTVTTDADDICVEVRYGPDNQTGDADEVYEGKKDARGIFRLERTKGGRARATLCRIDDRLIGDWDDGAASGLWKMDLAE